MSSLKILSEESIREHVSIEAAIENQREAFKAFARGDVSIPERIIDSSSPHGAVLFKPFVGKDAFGLKVVSIRPTGTPGVVLLFEPESAMPSALMNATYLTALRTAAGSAAAFSALSKEIETSSTPMDETPKSIVVFGAGLQAELHILCFCAIQAFETIYISNRTFENAETLATRLRLDPRIGETKLVAISPSQIVESIQKSRVIITTTPSREALFDGHCVASGTFIAAVGSFSPEMKELDSATMSRSRIVADNPEEVLRTSGDFVDQNRITCSLGDLLLRETTDAFRGSDVILFKSIGVAIQDLFISSLALASVPSPVTVKL